MRAPARDGNLEGARERHGALVDELGGWLLAGDPHWDETVRRGPGARPADFAMPAAVGGAPAPVPVGVVRGVRGAGAQSRR